MNYGFNHQQFDADLDAVREFFVKFLKSFGPSQKKVAEKPLGYFEEKNIRFRLMLVEMGISKIIRSVIAIVVGILVYFVLFRYASPVFKGIIALGFVLYYAWLLAPHLVEDFKMKDDKIQGKPVSIISGYLTTLHNERVDLQSAFFGLFKKTEKKK